METGPLDDDHNKGLRPPPFSFLLSLRAPTGLLKPPQLGAGDPQEFLKLSKWVARQLLGICKGFWVSLVGIPWKSGHVDDDHNKGLRTPPSLLLLPLGALKGVSKSPQVGAGNPPTRQKYPNRIAS